MENFDVTLDQLAGEAAVLRLYRQVFAVLAREAGAMILDVGSIDVDEAILEAFAEAGSEGLTIAQAMSACRRFERHEVERRIGVLIGYGAVSKVEDRPNELFYRAAFAPYVMLLFLRRMAERGGQSELHQLLTLEKLNVNSPTATVEDGRGSVARLTKVFSLLANELAILAAGGAVETLRDNAQLLWGNRSLIHQAEEVHASVLDNWPQLEHDCAALRISLAAYGDAIDAAAGRLIEQAGATRALGLLPPETWVSFARRSQAETLGGVLDRFVFDRPAPWFTPQVLTEAVESGRVTPATRIPPPRSNTAEEVTETSVVPVDDDVEGLRTVAEQILGGRDEIAVEEALDEAGDWLAQRRLLAEMTAAHHHPDLEYELTWKDGLRIDVAGSPSWVSDGCFRRLPDGAGGGR